MNLLRFYASPHPTSPHLTWKLRLFSSLPQWLFCSVFRQGNPTRHIVVTSLSGLVGAGPGRHEWILVTSLFYSPGQSPISRMTGVRCQLLSVDASDELAACHHHSARPSIAPRTKKNLADARNSQSIIVQLSESELRGC